MALYKYKAKSNTGAVVEGILDAKDAAEAVIKLKQSVSMIEDLKEINSKTGFLNGLIKGKIKEKNLALVCKQFSIILNAGLPIVRTIELVAGQSEDKAIKGILYEVADDVASGSSLADSFEKRGSGLPITFIETIRAGEETGRLDSAFEKLFNYLSNKSKVKSKVVSSLAYPLFVIGVAVAVIIIIMVFAVPVFSETFEGLGTALPLPTRILMGLSGFMTSYGLFLLLLIALIITAIIMYNKTDKGSINVSRTILKIPIIGKIQYMSAASQFSNTFATMISSGLPVMKGLEIAGKSMSNRFMGEAVLNSALGVEQGYSVGACLRADGKLPELLVEMVSVGEESGSLSDTLTVVGEYYDNEVDTATTRAVALLEPITICVLAVFVMLILLAVYLPLFSMYDNFNGQF